MCNIDFANYAFKEIVSRGNCVALVIDIKGFFDNLDHEILKKTGLIYWKVRISYQKIIIVYISL